MKTITTQQLRAGIDAPEQVGWLRRVSGVERAHQQRAQAMAAARESLGAVYDLRTGETQSKFGKLVAVGQEVVDQYQSGKRVNPSLESLETLHGLLSEVETVAQDFVDLPHYRDHQYALVERGADGLNAIQYALQQGQPEAFSILWAWYQGLGLLPEVLIEGAPVLKGPHRSAGAGAGAGAGVDRDVDASVSGSSASLSSTMTDSDEDGKASSAVQSGPQALLRWIIDPARGDGFLERKHVVTYWERVPVSVDASVTYEDVQKNVEELIIDQPLKLLVDCLDAQQLAEQYTDSRGVHQSIWHRACEAHIGVVISDCLSKLSADQLRAEDGDGETVLSRAISRRGSRMKAEWLLEQTTGLFPSPIFAAAQTTSAALGGKTYFSLAAMYGQRKALEVMFNTLGWAGMFMGSSDASLALCRQAYFDAVSAGNQIGVKWLLQQTQPNGLPVFSTAERSSLNTEAVEQALRYAAQHGMSAIANPLVNAFMDGSLSQADNTSVTQAVAHDEQVACFLALNSQQVTQIPPKSARSYLCLALYGQLTGHQVASPRLPVAGAVLDVGKHESLICDLIGQADSVIKPELSAFSRDKLNAVMLAARIGGDLLAQVLERRSVLEEYAIQVDTRGDTALNHAMEAGKQDSMEQLAAAGYRLLELKDVDQFLDVFGTDAVAWPEADWADQIAEVIGRVFGQCEVAEEASRGIDAQLDQVIALTHRLRALRAHMQFDAALVYAARWGQFDRLTHLLSLFDETLSRPAKARLALTSAEAGPQDANGAQTVLVCLNAGAEISRMSYATLVAGAGTLVDFNAMRVNGQSIFALACGQIGAEHLNALFVEANRAFGSGHMVMVRSSPALTVGDFVYETSERALHLPLESAASRGDRLQVRWLLENGADVNAVDAITLRTALMAAVAAGQHDVVIDLLGCAGINLLALNADGQSALDLSTNDGADFHEQLKNMTGEQLQARAEADSASASMDSVAVDGALPTAPVSGEWASSRSKPSRAAFHSHSANAAQVMEDMTATPDNIGARAGTDEEHLGTQTPVWPIIPFEPAAEPSTVCEGESGVPVACGHEAPDELGELSAEADDSSTPLMAWKSASTDPGSEMRLWERLSPSPVQTSDSVHQMLLGEADDANASPAVIMPPSSSSFERALPSPGSSTSPSSVRPVALNFSTSPMNVEGVSVTGHPCHDFPGTSEDQSAVKTTPVPAGRFAAKALGGVLYVGALSGFIYQFGLVWHMSFSTIASATLLPVVGAGILTVAALIVLASVPMNLLWVHRDTLMCMSSRAFVMPDVAASMSGLPPMSFGPGGDSPGQQTEAEQLPHPDWGRTCLKCG